MADLSSLERLRPCGRLETYSTARHHAGFHKNVGLTATYHTDPTTKLPTSLETLVFQVLHELIAKHPALSVIAIDEDKSHPNVWFVRLPEIDLRTCVEFHERRNPEPKDGESDEELDELLTKQHDRDFKDGLGTKPFWRLVVVASAAMPNTFTASWFFHHAIADGMSSVVFHETFLAALNAISPEAAADSIVKSPSTPILPSLEEMNPMRISWPFFLQAVSGAILPWIFGRPPAKLWSGNPVPEDAELIQNPHYRTLAFSADTTKRLAQVCRAEKTSVTAALECLLVASLFAALPAEDYERIKMDGPISMQRFLQGVGQDQIVNATTAYGYVHQRSSSATSDSTGPDVLQHFSWDKARSVKSVIQAEVAKEGRDNPVALLKYVPDVLAFINGRLGQPRGSTAELSNIGVYKSKADDNGHWKIGRMLFSTCAFGGGALAVGAVTGGDGNAVLNFCWMEGAVEEKLIGEVIQGVKEGVEGLVNAAGLRAGTKRDAGRSTRRFFDGSRIQSGVHIIQHLAFGAANMAK